MTPVFCFPFFPLISPSAKIENCEDFLKNMVENWNGSSMVFLSVVELLHARSEHSWAPWVRKCGKLPNQENFAITWQTSTTQPSASQAHQRKISGSLWWGFFGAKQMATRVLWSINNLKVQGSQLRTKRNLLQIYCCNEIGSSAFGLG